MNAAALATLTLETLSTNFIPGLASVTFRQLPVERVVAIAATAKLRAIEWGGDIHVPHGNIGAALAARQRCAHVNITISAYGSYYRAGGDPSGLRFSTVLETAVALGTSSIRVWAGGVGSAQASSLVFGRVRDDLVSICRQAQCYDVRITMEYHSGTLTDTPDSTLLLLKAVNQPNLRTYWQPRVGDSLQAGVDAIGQLQAFLGDLHSFHWWPDHNARLSLAEGADRWAAYLRAAASDGATRFVSLEFVRGDSQEQLGADADTLHGILAAR